MLTLYHSVISPNSRRVWITLLEKGLEFKLVEIKLDGEQFKPEFLAISPFHHVPVLVDDGFNVIESLAILDYIEAKYPIPAMLPLNSQDLAIARMVQLVTVNELNPSLIPLSAEILDLPGGNPEKIAQAKQKVSTVLNLFESLLDEHPFFGSQSLTLADVVAGTVVPWLRRSSIAFSDYPKLNAWVNRLVTRSSWQTTEVPIEVLKARMSARM